MTQKLILRLSARLEDAPPESAVTVFSVLQGGVPALEDSTTRARYLHELGVRVLRLVHASRSPTNA
jgi:microsomal dipeptidase-like Zn-dependent dipeptidase